MKRLTRQSQAVEIYGKLNILYNRLIEPSALNKMRSLNKIDHLPRSQADE
jgi:hypothetical protein